MRPLLLLPLLLYLSPSLADLRPRKPVARSYDTHRYYALELHPSSPEASALEIAESLGVELVEPLGELAGHWIVRAPGYTPSHDALDRRRSLSAAGEEHHDHIMRRWSADWDRRGSAARSLTPLTLRKRSKRMPPPHRRPIHPQLSTRNDDTELLYAQNDLNLHDPMLNQQWHLINTDMRDIELNVTGLWGRGITGKGIKVVIVDDGLDMTSDDLKDNFYPEGSYDFNDHTDLPAPRLSDDQHGTRCAGEIAAAPNDVCGVGVSYNAKIAGVRILSAPISDADEASALNYAYQLNDIYSCSWGPPDDGRSMEAPEGVILKAFVNGVQQGRGGKGSIFVFAAGNGGGADDQCNFDGYTNSIFSLTIGAVDRKGLHPYYSELCSAMMMVAPSSGSGDHIHTTDVGKNVCAHNHGGTSAAAPLAAGVLALALGVRPDLTWRDVQHVALRSSVFFNPDDPDWEKTAVGRSYSYKYGYGRMDAGRFVDVAESWKLVKPQAWFDSPAVYLPSERTESIHELFPDRYYRHRRQEPEGQGEGGEPIEVTPLPPPPAPKPDPGQIIPPEGISSSFEVTKDMLSGANFETLEHITVRVWIGHSRRGDVEVEITSPNGIKSVLARQRRFDDDKSGFPGWKFMSLKHWEENPVGTWTIHVKDQGKADQHGRFVAWSLQLWGECVDPALARLWAPAEEGQQDEEEVGSKPTVSQKPKPTEHLPDDHGEAEGEAHKPGLATPNPTGTGIPANEPPSGMDESIFDGVAGLAKSSTWLAGAGLIVLLSGVGLGAFFYFRSRRRSRNLFGLSNNGEGARGAYAPVSEDVPMGLLERSRRRWGGGKGATGGQAGSKELYDAFGDGPSDESDDESDGAGDRTGLRYHDEFLDDEGDGEHRGAGYRDDHDEEKRTPTQNGKAEEGRRSPGGSGGSGGVQSQSGSSDSWQDAEDDTRH